MYVIMRLLRDGLAKPAAATDDRYTAETLAQQFNGYVEAVPEIMCVNAPYDDDYDEVEF